MDDKPGEEAVLPDGVEWRGDELLLDPKYGLLQVSPGLALVVEQAGPDVTTATLRLAQGGALWVSCSCSATGGCEVELRQGPDPSKGTVVCVSKGCTGGCTQASGWAPPSLAFTAALTDVIRRHSTHTVGHEQS
jgi:hypothetical protein